MCERISNRLPLARSHPGPALQPRHVPWPIIKPETFQFVGRRPTHQATPDRAAVGTFYCEPVVLLSELMLS